MSYNVDVDEADVAVLSQNLTKAKDAFVSINKSLNRISVKSADTSKNIKPILKDVNRLSHQRKQISKGIDVLQEVSDAAGVISQYESVLVNSIEFVGLSKFIKTLEESKQYFVKIKPSLKRFANLLISFDNLIDKSNIKLQSYLQALSRADSATYANDKTKLHETRMILNYFHQTDDIGLVQMFVKARRDLLFQTQSKLEPATKPVERPPNIPYEKGTNGINRFNNELIRSIKDEVVLLELLQLPVNQHIDGIVERTIGELYNQKVINNFNHFFHNTLRIIDNDTFVLEIIENLLHFQKFLKNYSIQNKDFDNSISFFITKSSILFKEYFTLIERKFSGQVLNDTNIPQITVELVSKMRRVSEFEESCLRIAEQYKLGDWLVVKPPLRFVSVYTSLIPNNAEETTAYLLSSFFSDLIDCIMINIEIGLKSQELSVKKSTQGFYLIKNLIMVETIINKSKSLYSCLGSTGNERIGKLKNRFLKLFLDDWNYASYIIIRDMTTIATTSAHSGGVSSGLTGMIGGHMTNKEREQIKELFKTFNESFEDALRNYEKYNISDANLRVYLASEIKKLITSAYFKLYDKYGNSDFTKNKQKYVKYDKQLFERLLSEKLQ